MADNPHTFAIPTTRVSNVAQRRNWRDWRAGWTEAQARKRAKEHNWWMGLDAGHRRKPRTDNPYTSPYAGVATTLETTEKWYEWRNGWFEARRERRARKSPSSPRALPSSSA